MPERNEPGLTSASSIHLIGAGGAGMSALARLLHAQGYKVSGSDLQSSPVLQELSQLGVEVWPGSQPERMAGCGLVVASSAVPEQDLERQAAHRAGVPVWERPRLLAEITDRIPTAGFGGTHGKTTSTAMAVRCLRAAGADPSYVIGGDPVDLEANAHLGGDQILVLESDEAFRTMTFLHLAALLVTNVDTDHVEHYGTMQSLQDAFVQVATRVNGPVVIGGDDPGGRRLAERTGYPTYGTDPDAVWQIVNLRSQSTSTKFTMVGPQVEVEVEVGKPGLHMARNACGVLALLTMLGYDPNKAARGLARFKGVKRRLEVKGQVAGVTVVDTYAHHPTEISADLQALQSAQYRRLWAVFQPHLYSRTSRLAPEFGQALAAADRVVVTDIYGAREKPMPGVSGKLVRDAAVQLGHQGVDYVARADLTSFLGEKAQAGDVVVIMGAGDITQVAGELVHVLARRS